eukprot:TRINITY_DN8880_c0_g1_i3.p2 TRINITY_DN8880_c0_g1~~TRINITY_DN8880_c0_g1_i3.p2  ORF type:complete len:271 (-),score=17.81 TRINITY_DN8880_c0_g1_i3:115-927(-)
MWSSIAFNFNIFSKQTKNCTKCCRKFQKNKFQERNSNFIQEQIILVDANCIFFNFWKLVNLCINCRFSVKSIQFQFFFISIFSIIYFIQAVCGALIIVSGITSSIIFGMLANKTHKYKLIFRICAGISTVALGLLIGSMYTEKPFLLYASAFLYGFGAMSLMPITSEYGCEQFFPLGEALITGCFVCSGSIVGSALIFLYTEVIENDKKSSTLFMHLVFIGCGFVSLLLTCFFTEDLKRTQFNKESEFKKIPLETNEDQIEANVELQQVQ